MTGKQLKEQLRLLGRSQREIADLYGCSPQALTSLLNAEDVKSGVIERLSEVLSVPVSYFYGEGGGQQAIANGAKSVAAVNSEVNVGDNERVKYLERLLEEKERTIQILMKK